ncbi:hypothetical protein Tco_1395913, partial [Tanacetum coccineum]
MMLVVSRVAGDGDGDGGSGGEMVAVVLVVNERR